MAVACLGVITIALNSMGACQHVAPGVEADRRPTASGTTASGTTASGSTISGTVRGLEGASALAGRRIEVVNLSTGERQRAVTSNSGWFSFTVRPGQYRVELALAPGDTVVKEPGVMKVNRRGVDAHADFIVRTVKASRPRAPGMRSDPGLGPPIALHAHRSSQPIS